MTTTGQITAVQIKLGLTADGIAGPQTWAAILQAVGASTAPSPLPPMSAPFVASKWPSEAAAASFYGRSDGSERWENENLVEITPPYAMNMDGTKIRLIKCHRRVAESLLRILHAIKDHFRGAPEAIRAAGMDRYDGCYNFRNVRGAGHLSMHAYGAAIDFDAAENPLGATHGKMQPAVVAIFKAEGWRWGGDYTGRKDPMHYEACT